MTERSAVRRRIQFSLRSLLVVTGLLALLLTPVAWMARQREQVRQARDEAIRSFYLEQQYRDEQRKGKVAEIAAIDRAGSIQALQDIPPRSHDTTAQIEQLERENAELKKTVELLRREIQRRKDLNR